MEDNLDRLTQRSIDADMVNHPAHYTIGNMETIDIIKEIVAKIPDSFQAYLVSNVVKYICRFPHKGNPTQDIEKSLWYLNRLLLEVKETNKI